MLDLACMADWHVILALLGLGAPEHQLSRRARVGDC
jgi:hypothetical protein